MAQVNLNADPKTPNVVQLMPVSDPTLPGVVQVNINADPTTPGIVQANLNFDPTTPGIIFVNFNSSAPPGSGPFGGLQLGLNLQVGDIPLVQL